jgi:required for meiotic nuclear division protein 1
MDVTPVTSETITLRAVLLGQRLDTKGLERQDTIALMPVTQRVGEKGVAFLFRYGVVVLVGLSPAEEAAFLESLRFRVTEPLATPEVDQVSILIKPEGEDQIDPSGVIVLKDASTDRLQIVANVMSKSVVLALHETQIASAFDRIEPLAAGIRRRGRGGRDTSQLVRQIGELLLTQHRMVGRVAVEDKPDVLWDRPELERLYARLADEYELLERSRAIDRKLTLLSETARTLLDLVQNQRSVRLEWYIIGLIFIEILLSLYELFLRGR